MKRFPVFLGMPRPRVLGSSVIHLWAIDEHLGGFGKGARADGAAPTPDLEYHSDGVETQAESGFFGRGVKTDERF